MASNKIKTLPEFNPSDPNTGAKEWERYKRDFLIHLDALGLDDKPGKRKVGMLLANMGHEAIKIYDAFTWAVAVQANADAGIEAREAEDKHNLETVFGKFDKHFGVHNYRNIKRQEFLNTKRGKKSIMDYISELKRKAEFCEYGEQKEGLICDMIINGVSDRKCSEKLMEIEANELTLEKVIQTCRQVELTNAHLKTLDAENPSVNYANASHGASHPSMRKVSRHREGYQGNNPYCDRCCKHHAYRNCPAFDKICDACGQKGHFKRSNRCPGYRSQRGAPRGVGIRRPRGRFRGHGNVRSQRQSNVNYVRDDSTAQ